MTNHMQTIKRHKLAIALAILLSIVVSFPQVYFRIDHKDDGIYQGIELMPDSPWSPRAREVQDGHPNFGAIYYKDGKEDPYLFQPLGSMVVGYMGKVFSLDINNTILLSRIILSFITFLLIYSFVFLFSRNKFAALSSSSVILFAMSLTTYSGIAQLLQGLSPEEFINIARPINPAMVYILFFGFLTSFWLFYKRKDWRLGILSAVLLGLNFYNYFYTWTYLFAFGGILGLIFLFQKKWRDALRIASVYIGSLIVAIPYIINLYRATLHPAYAEASLRFGVVESHTPLFIGFVALTALIVFLWKFPREDKMKYYFGLALLLTPFVTLNQQLLTGKILQPNHYHWFFHKPIAIIFTIVIIFYILSVVKLDSYKKLLAGLIIGVSVITGMFIQVKSYYHGTGDGGAVAIERQKYGPVMRWLNENAEKEAVVFANNETSHTVVVYTPLNVFYYAAAIYSLGATNERLTNVLFSFYRLRGIDEDGIEQVFNEERRYISGNIYGMHYREKLGAYERIPDEKIEKIVSLYKESLLTPSYEWLRNIFSKYEVEYLLWDKTKDPEWQLDKYPFFEEVADFGKIVIYKFSGGT